MFFYWILAFPVILGTMFLGFCLATLFDGEHVLTPKPKEQVRLINIWPFSEWQITPIRHMRKGLFSSIKNVGGHVFNTVDTTLKNGEGSLGSKDENKTLLQLIWDWSWPIAYGLVVGIAFMSSVSGATVLAIIMLLALWAMQAYLIWLWFDNGSNLKEYIVFSLIMLISFWATKAITVRIAYMIPEMTLFFILIPTLILVGGLGACLINLMYAYAEFTKRTWMKTLSKVLIAVLAILLVVIVLIKIL